MLWEESAPDHARAAAELVGVCRPGGMAAMATFVMARGALEPQGRWDDFVDDFEGLVRQFNGTADDGATTSSEYLLITVER